MLHCANAPLRHYIYPPLMDAMVLNGSHYCACHSSPTYTHTHTHTHTHTLTMINQWDKPNSAISKPSSPPVVGASQPKRSIKRPQSSLSAYPASGEGKRFLSKYPCLPCGLAAARGRGLTHLRCEGAPAPSVRDLSLSQDLSYWLVPLTTHFTAPEASDDMLTWRILTLTPYTLYWQQC